MPNKTDCFQCESCKRYFPVFGNYMLFFNGTIQVQLSNNLVQTAFETPANGEKQIVFCDVKCLINFLNSEIGCGSKLVD